MAICFAKLMATSVILPAFYVSKLKQLSLGYGPDDRGSKKLKG